MNYEEALDKVRKLLRLSQSDNPNEAALAASRAQEIMDRFKIEKLGVESSLNGDAPDEPIRDFGIDPLDTSYASWKGRLAMGLAKQNQCKVYKPRGGLALIGRASDVTAVRYLYGWMVREVERLARRDCAGTGRTYWNNYRLGVVETVCRRLADQAHVTTAAVKTEAVAVSPMALVLVEKALAKREKQSAEVEAWTKQNMNLRSGGTSYTRGNYSAREAGRQAGYSVRMGGSAGNLGSGNLRLA